MAVWLTVLSLVPFQVGHAQQRFVQGTSSARTTSTSTGVRSLGQAHVEVDTETRSLIVTTDAETNEHIKKVIEQLDRPVPQALIKVLFLEVTHDRDLDVGADIKYDATNRAGQRSILSSLFGVAAATDGAIAQILDSDLTVTLRALAQVAKLEVLSRPSIMARNNEQATITIGQEVPFIRNSRVTTDGQTINTVEYEDIGIILTVTPRINTNGLIELDVSPEISTLTGDTVPISDTIQAPVFAKRSAETHVVVPNGKTVVIGGLMEDQETEQIRKIPILGDIWGLGALFRRKITSKSKTELLIFLTPTIVEANRNMVDVSKAERENATLIPQAAPPERLERFLAPPEVPKGQ